MKKYTTVLLLVTAITAHAQTTHELTNIGNAFDPPLINMIAGDSIHLVLSDPHTCTQVDETTWMNNGNTPNGGFNYPAGEHTFALDVPGTYYYVCTPHANMGMKGKSIVAINMDVQEQVADVLPRLFPSPASQQVTLTGLSTGSSVEVLDLKGQVVLRPTTANSTLDVSGLEVGTYIVLVRDQQGAALLNERLVISR